MALARLEIDATEECINERRYPIFLAVGNRRIEIADFTNIPTCRYHIRMAYRRFAVPEPTFDAEPNKLVAPWFELP